jgi:hypothetical protein
VSPEPATRLSRQSAALLVALLTLVALALRLARLRHGLPHVFHSDFFQIDQAVSLLRHGWFVDRHDYPLALVYVYAAAGWLTFQVQSVLGTGPGAWAGFVERFADPAVHHAVGRLVTVLAGCLIVPAVYRLARVRHARGVALLAAAALAVDPVHVLTSLQVRPHVPAMTLIVLVSPWMLRLIERARAGPGLALRCGAGLGLCAAVFQLGYIALAWALALAALRLRPLARLARLLPALLLGFALALAAVNLPAQHPDVARPPAASSALEPAGTLSMPARMLGWGHAERFSENAGSWLAAEPAVAVGLLAFLLACSAGRLRTSDLLLYASFPLLVVVVMGVLVGAHVRYVLAIVPFLAVLAAAGTLTLRPRGMRWLLSALLVVLPAAASLRALALLDTVDTRVALAGVLERLSQGTTPGEAPLTVAWQDRLVIDRGRLPPGVIEFPAYDDLAGRELATRPPHEALASSGARLYARVPGIGWANGPLAPAVLERLGFRLYGSMPSAPPGRLHLPDVPDRLFPDLWRTHRAGPPIELWVAGEEATERVAAVASPGELARWTAGPSASPAAAARAAPGSVSCDLDGDGTTEVVATNLSAALLTDLLALPTQDWRSQGGALPATGGSAPSLAVHGTPGPEERVLLVVRHARPDSRAWLVLGLSPLDAPFKRGRLLPAPDLVVAGLGTGPAGAFALGGIWPRGTPAGLSVWIQVWVADEGGPAGFVASQALSAITPD